MATLQATIRGVLTGDATYMAAMPGGVHDAETLQDREWIEMEDIRDANGRLKSTTVIRWRGAALFGPEVLPTEARFCELWFYEDTGYEDIETAKRRAKALLHRQLFLADNAALVYLIWAGDLGEMTADEFGGASMDRSRYQTIIYRA
jgi:hypothetical protein